ncbi:amidase family protein [Alkalihalobacillus oceani]|uniref:amidase family protein n=1 Tax=Halalkalibacter oceani TaxID=1653776 RepID=UPI00203C3104|nr:amidase family protein [Halalkalibacter oceani]MCM3762511.1 amidase family protein [Halalkalibacter oceani]
MPTSNDLKERIRSPRHSAAEADEVRHVHRRKPRFLALIVMMVAIIGLVPVNSALALTSLPSDNGVEWEFHDAAPPNLDTGSIRRAVGTPMQGFGNIFVQVSASPEPRLNGEMMRGFGLEFDGAATFETNQSVNLGDVLITREIYFAAETNTARFFDTFTNIADEPVTVDVSFGGSLGYGTGDNQGAVQATSSGDLMIDGEDAWLLVATPDEEDHPVGVVLGSPEPFAGALQGTGNQQRNPFETPLATTGHEANFYGLIHQLEIEPGETKSLVRFVVAGETGEEGAEQTVESLEQLAEQPDFSNLTTEELCTVGNWDLSQLAEFDEAACPELPRLDVPQAPAEAEMYTTAEYDVTNKTIAELQRDLQAGVTTSEEITRAYLDRIAAYDGGQLGFHAFVHVADDAIEQARAADEARSNGAEGALLGIPIAIKDIIDTKDMPTTGGSRALAGWEPATDAYQVEQLRQAGAVIIGKTNTSEFANSGSFSESGWMQTWNALYPSKTSFGSSGGSAVSVATSMAPAALGSQTGVSLYAPAVGASLTTFRGTDGMASVHGVMPLTWGQDYVGPIARTVTDLAYLLNVTTGTDELDMLTADADAYKPDDWTEYLDRDALQGKRIGYIPSSFESSFADDGTGEATLEHFADLEAGGATMIEMSEPPNAGDRPSLNMNGEGWARYIELHEDFPYQNGDQVRSSPDVLLYNQRDYEERERMTEEEVEQWLAYRARYKEVIAEWMDEYDVDVVVYPGFLSDVYNNDSAAAQLTADRATGVLTSNVGLPTVVVPVGLNPHGYSISMQLVGRAWDDGDVLGMGYALEQQTQAQLLTEFAPPLEQSPIDEPEEQPRFADVGGHWAADYIDTLVELGLISGYPDGTFRPNASISRAEAARIIARELGLEDGESSFADVAAGHWAAADIGAVESAGILTGYPDGTFKPDGRLSRQEMAVILVRAYELSGDSSASFSDVSEGSWSYPYIAALTSNQVTSGYLDGTFRPSRDITRAEFSVMVARVIE